MKKNKLSFESSPIDVSTAPKSSDGALILKATPMKAGDYEYFGFELSGAENRGYRWDEVLIGHLTIDETKKVLDKFKGLPLTDEHVFVPVGERKEYACGTVLKEGVIDGDLVHTEALVHDPKVILKITNGSANELSIGFYSAIVWNEEKAEGEPDFYITDIDLNHVAVVEEGRAGPDARLSHHKAKMEKDPMKKIMINGVEFSVDDAVAQEFERLNASETELKNSSTKVEGERDAALGQLAAANQRLENSSKDVDKRAAKIASEHSKFIEEAQKLSHDTSKMKVGDYDITKAKAEILIENGVAVPDEASAEYVNGAWLVAVSNSAKTTDDDKSALDNVDPERIENKSAQDRSVDAQRNFYFGKGKK